MTSLDCPTTSSLHPLITQNSVETNRFYCPFLDRGFCRDKSKCNFSHERNNSIKVPLDYCHFYLANRCLYGVECKFQHVEPFASTSDSQSSGSSTLANNTIELTREILIDPTSSSSRSNESNRKQTINLKTSAITLSNTNDNISRDENPNEPPSNSAFHQNRKEYVEVLNQQRSQPPQIVHHPQYWYHPTIGTSSNTCPFLAGTNSSMYQGNGFSEHNSDDYHVELNCVNQHTMTMLDTPAEYLQINQDDQYVHNDHVPLRSCSSLPTLLDHYVDIHGDRVMSSQQEERSDLNLGIWFQGSFCRRHSIGHIDMISDEHLLLSCDLCGQRCLQPADLDQQRLHRDECLRELEQEMELSFAIQRSKDKVCGICMDIVVEKKPVTSSRFGILEKCSHIFCLDCIRKWRGTKQFENRTIRACPECRTCSDFVVPSKYWVEDKDDKEKLIRDYKANLRSKACKYFDEGRGECPFAGACFYKHAYPDGRIAKFDKPKPSRRYNSRGISLAAARLIVWNLIRSTDDEDDDDEEIDHDIENDTDDEDDDNDDIDVDFRPLEDFDPEDYDYPSMQFQNLYEDFA